jgi:hypothetical protein
MYNFRCRSARGETFKNTSHFCKFLASHFHILTIDSGYTILYNAALIDTQNKTGISSNVLYIASLWLNGV